ncbi:MAG: ABC transporter substrate-binding protein [Candidatus Caldatribacteriaceae bacterium]
MVWKRLLVLVLCMVFLIGAFTSHVGAQGKTITILAGGGPHLLSPRRAAEIYEKESGNKVVIVESPHKDLYAKALTDLIVSAQSYDAFQFLYTQLATFVAGGFIQPIDNYIKKYDAETLFGDIIPSMREMYTRWGGKTYAFVYDGDTHSYYYRKDLFDDPQVQADFKARFGYDLRPAETWEEYLDISKFFYETDYVPYGDSELAQRGRMYLWWANRFFGYGGEWFDEEGRPAINSEAGIKALENFKEGIKYCPPGVLNFEFSEQQEAWLSGSIPHFVQWGDAWLDGQLSPASKVKGKIGIKLPPNGVVCLATGWAYAIPFNAKNPEEAFQYLRIMTFGENSVWAVTQPGSGVQPYLAKTHFGNPEVTNALGEEFLKGYMECIAKGKPDLRLPYAAEFVDILDLYLSKALAGEIGSKEALDAVAEKWVELLERYFGSSTLPEKFRPMLRY